MRTGPLSAVSLLSACCLWACGSSQPAANAADAATGDSAGESSDATAASKRNTRYCEVLEGKLGADAVNIDVYSTQGLNDCPDAAWQALDTGALKAASGADIVLLNGPRYWTLDSLAGSVLQDPVVKSFGGIEMRKAGQINVPTAGMASFAKPYVLRTIQRKSNFRWLAGREVYELRDADGHSYVMQSCSAQKQPLTLADLPTLAAKLTTLPAGWSYAPRTLATDLNLLATAGDATVVQDELGNTYSME